MEGGEGEGGTGGPVAPGPNRTPAQLPRQRRGAEDRLRPRAQGGNSEPRDGQGTNKLGPCGMLGTDMVVPPM